MINAAVLTISDTRSLADDQSGKAVQELLPQDKYELAGYEIVKDDIKQIEKRLRYFSHDLKVDLVLTNGGTGLGPRDVTPEATRLVIDKEIPGIAEMMRMEGIKKTNRAVLSRSVAGLTGQTLIINLPGSPAGARESLEIILAIIPHALNMVQGKKHNT
jgi:molybdenum cofactor synthesis domain